MEPIISPWLIYLLGLVESLGTVLFLLLLGFSLVTGAMFIHGTAEGYFRDPDSNDLRFIRRIKQLLLCTTITLLLSIFIPSRSTIIGMIVAQNLTKDNVKVALQTGKDIHEALKKDVLDIIEAIKDKPEEKK